MRRITWTNSEERRRCAALASVSVRHGRAVREFVGLLALVVRSERRVPSRTVQLASILIVFLSTAIYADESVSDDLRQLEFFETKIRPLLVDRCYECHSAKSQALKAGFRIDSKAGLLKGGDSGPAIVPGKPDESLLIESIRYESNEMPPNEKLSDAEISALTKWVALGAPWPKESTGAMQSQDKGYDWPALARHWAWQPIRKVEPPVGEGHDRIRNPIDQFVTAGLRDAGLKQAETAPAAVFVRRAFVDLIGMPPTPSELEDWTKQLTANSGSELNHAAVRELVDTLLKRPQYGERWGRHWLDVARYSELGGWTQDNRPHPMAFQYRDWVVRAFNADMPYNEFVWSQIAGDKIDREAAVGTGFFALGPNYSSDGGDPASVAQAKSETLDDRVDTFSRAFLALTVACARCHDHKFDPIPTQDYYSIAGVFNNSREGETALVEDHVMRDYHDQQRAISELLDKIKKSRQTAKQEKREISEEEQAQIDTWQKDADERKAKAPPKYDFAHTIHDSGSSDMQIALRGNMLKPGGVAPRRFLRIVAGEEREHFTEGSGRQQLADAVVDPDNPLTARVIVNRIWLHHFGMALVRTPNNFGTLGEKPTHPELLDWLAATFIESDWSIKSMHRLIMTSATYRTSSAFNETAFASDGDNRSIWRMNPRRMDVETWRDSLLAVTGELDVTMGGPSVDDIVNSSRRTLYAKISRNDPLASDEFLRLFDFPIPRASNAKRTSYVIPQQFLFMMNSQFMLDRALALAERLQNESNEPKSRIERAYTLLYGRKPSDRESRLAMRFLESESPAGNGPNRWQQYCQVLLSANEFMYIR